MEVFLFVCFVVALVSVVLGGFIERSLQIDYRKRWQEAMALLQGDEPAQIESGETWNGWRIEGQQTNGNKVGGMHHGEKCTIIVLYAKKDDKVIKIPYDSRGDGIVMGTADFVENMKEYKQRAIETVKTLDTLV